MLTGPRRGEISALRWRHVDLDRGQLWIERSNSQPKSGLKEKRTKTNQRRKLALDEHTVSLLRTHRDMWAARCAALGCQLGTEAFVFSPAPDGSTPYLPRAISQRYRKLALRLKLAVPVCITSSLLCNRTQCQRCVRYSDVAVFCRLGHGRGGATTLKVYAAWVGEADRGANACSDQAKTRRLRAPKSRSPTRKSQPANDSRSSAQLHLEYELPTVARHCSSINTVLRRTARALKLL
jgi:hypothetical protein